MKSGDRLIKLIEALSPNEKGYFKKQASTNRKESKQLMLFDFLCKQNTYDEQQIAKKFKRFEFTKNLRIINKSLETAILKSMRTYHSGKSAQRTLSALLADVEFTFKNELYDSSLELVEKAEQLAETENLLEFNLLFRNWKHRIKKRLLADYVQEVSWLIDEEKEYNTQISKLERESQLFFWESKVLSLSKGLYNQIVAKELDASIDAGELLGFDTTNLSTFSKFRYYNICGMYYYYSKMDFRTAFNNYLKAKQTLVEDEHKTNKHFVNHFNILITLMSNATYTDRVEEYTALRQELDQLPEIYNRLKTQALTTLRTNFLITFNDLMYCNHVGDYEQGHLLVEQLIQQQGSVIKKNEYFHSLTLYLNAHLNFLSGDYNKAFDWLNQLLYSPIRLTNNKIYYHAKLLEIVMHTDLSNDRFIHNLLRNFVRYLHRKGRKLEFEKVLLKCFRSKSKHARLRDWVEELNKLYPELYACKVELTRDIPYLDIISWVRSKIESRSFHEVLSDKLKQLKPH